jgi:hypothetical protein
LPESFQAAIEELKQSVAVLADELVKEKLRSALGAAANSPNCAAAKLDSHLPADSIADPSSAVSAANQRGAERRGYTVPEFMALFDGDLASLSGFEQVQCHDLSSTGVSFFLNRPLDQRDNLLITLGQRSGGVIMTAVVVYSRPIIVRGEDRYRIGCKFGRRLEAMEAAALDPSLSSARGLYSITALGN